MHLETSCIAVTGYTLKYPSVWVPSDRRVTSDTSYLVHSPNEIIALVQFTEASQSIGMITKHTIAISLKNFLGFTKYQTFLQNILVICFINLLFKTLIVRLHMALKFLFIKISMCSI